jgi:hypothetical protein
MNSIKAIHQAKPEQQTAVAQLLKSVFGPELPPSLLSPGLLRWKFFSPRPGSTGSRAYVLCRAEKIHAHLAEWPISFLSLSGEVSTSTFFDWAARPEAKGTGVRILQHLLERHETALAIGGSAPARNLLPRMGFKPHGTVDIFARIVRPWRQYRPSFTPSYLA